MLTMALMALCFALMLRDNTFSWYAGYIFCYALIQSIQTGFLFHPLEFGWLAPSASLLESAAIALSVAFAALFMARFCELQRFAPLLRTPVLALAIGMPLLVLMRSSSIDVLVDVAQALVDPLLILGALLMLLAATVAAAHGSRHAWFFLVGWTPLLALTALSTAQLSGSTSLTQPFRPAEPSSVVTLTPSQERLASTTPKSRSSLAAPSTISTWQPRSRRSWASQKSGALP